MGKRVVLCLLLLLLSGCSGSNGEMEQALELRTRLLQAQGCSFDGVITADYGNRIHTFSMACLADAGGDITFQVTAPDTISGICGKLSGAGGQILFDDTVLAVELLAEEQLSPLSAPWIFLKTLRSGCMTSVCREDGQLRISVDDSYEEDPLRLDIWLNAENKPEHADVLYDGRRILSLDVENFQIL